MHAQNRWLILVMISSALFLIITDMTVLYTALPRLTLALDATASQKLWIVNAYPLVVAGLLPGAGMLSDRLGHKNMFIAGLPVFALASLCAAFSPSAQWLIAARAFLAVGAAMMMPATLSIVRHVFTDERERALAIGIWAGSAWARRRRSLTGLFLVGSSISDQRAGSDAGTALGMLFDPTMRR